MIWRMLSVNVGFAAAVGASVALAPPVITGILLAAWFPTFLWVTRR